MGLRPGHCYSDKKQDRAYTRLAVKVHRRNYIGAAPGLKTRQFNMGNGAKKYSHIVDLVVDESVNVRDNAIEAVRIMVTRYITKHLGKENFFMRVRIYPHHILRENKQAKGAHADRIQQGMSHAFGKPIGRAARVRPNQKIVSILVEEQNVNVAKNAFKRVFSKLPCSAHVRVGTDVESIGTLPKKKIREPTKTKGTGGVAEATGEKAEEGKDVKKKGAKGKDTKAETPKDAKGKDAKADGKKDAKGKDAKTDGKKDAKKK
ncbi:MAG: 50S ribosomal protein L16 [Candidatus Diapherotrites archaeon]